MCEPLHTSSYFGLSRRPEAESGPFLSRRLLRWREIRQTTEVTDCGVGLALDAVFSDRLAGTDGLQTLRWRETDSNRQSQMRGNQLTRASRLTDTGAAGPTPAPAALWRERFEPRR